LNSTRSLSAQDLSGLQKILEAYPHELETWSFQAWLEALEKSQSIALEQEGQVRAFILYEDRGHELEVLQLATHPQFTGQGLMSQLIRQLQSRGLPLHLEVKEGNIRATKLYKDLNFQLVRKRERYYKDGTSALIFTWKP